jgi:hypothetical protein
MASMSTMKLSYGQGQWFAPSVGKMSLASLPDSSLAIEEGMLGVEVKAAVCE